MGQDQGSPVTKSDNNNESVHEARQVNEQALDRMRNVLEGSTWEFISPFLDLLNSHVSFCAVSHTSHLLLNMS